MQANARNKVDKRPLCIFMADDNPDALMTLALVLRDEGYVVHTCANPNIALEAIRRERPDVCMLDVKMPGRSGYDLAREILAAGLVPGAGSDCYLRALQKARGTTHGQSRGVSSLRS